MDRNRDGGCNNSLSICIPLNCKKRITSKKSRCKCSGICVCWIENTSKTENRPLSYMEFRANGEGDCKRDAKDIPWQEAMGAVCQALEDQFSLPEEDLIRAAANLMGISRIGSSVYELFLHGIRMAEKFNRIQKADNGNWVAV